MRRTSRWVAAAFTACLVLAPATHAGAIERKGTTYCYPEVQDCEAFKAACTKNGGGLSTQQGSNGETVIACTYYDWR